MTYQRVRVNCYAGGRAEETPRRFHLDDRCVEVASVLDRWLTPEYRCFKVAGDDGRHYLLRYDMQAHHWQWSPGS